MQRSERGGALGVYKASHLIRGWILWWSHGLTALLEVGLTGGRTSLGTHPWRAYPTPGPSCLLLSASRLPEVSSFPLPCPFAMFLPHWEPKSIGTSHPQTETRKQSKSCPLWSRFSQVPCHGDKKLANTVPVYHQPFQSYHRTGVGNLQGPPTP